MNDINTLLRETMRRAFQSWYVNGQPELSRYLRSLRRRLETDFTSPSDDELIQHVQLLMDNGDAEVDESGIWHLRPRDCGEQTDAAL